MSCNFFSNCLSIFLVNENEMIQKRKKQSVKANKKILKDKLSHETGKAVTLKDITNLRSSMEAKNTRNNLEECVQKLTDTYGN